MSYKAQKIFEDMYEQEMRPILSELMTDRQIKRAMFYLSQVNTRQSEMSEMIEEWSEIEEMYASEKDQPSDEDSPNSFINVILPSIEGQVSSVTEQNITANCRGKGMGDQSFGRTANIIAATVLKENHIRDKVKRFGRRYIMFGNGVMAIDWNPDMLEKAGLPEFRTPFPGHILVDGKIKNMEDLQKADYIIEIIGQVSIMWARDKYGDELADAVTLGNSSKYFEATAEESGDDKYSFTLLNIWTRNNKERNLQKIEMSLCGVILSESDSSKPYYKYVNNQYPFAYAGLYPREGQFHRFGDGKILKPIQSLINKIFDEIVLAVRFAAHHRTFVNPKANLKVSEFDSNPKHPIFCDNPQQNILVAPAGGVNDVVFSLINILFQKVQEVTRFSALMTGNSPGSMTATQAGIQMQQGNSGINDKRLDIKTALEFAVEYAISLCMEYWAAPQALRVTDNEDEFEWVDAAQGANVPVMLPATEDYKRAWRDKNKRAKSQDLPKWMQLFEDEEEKDDAGNVVVDSEGKAKTKSVPATKRVSLDIDITVGEGMPSNKMAQYNIILSLAQLQLIDEQTGQPRPLMSYETVRKNVEDLLGIKISDPTPQGMQGQVAGALGIPNQFANMPNVSQMPGMGAKVQQPINQNPNVPGANMGGQMKGGNI